MDWSSKISESANFETGVRECLSAIEADLEAQPHLLIAFISPDFQALYQDLPGLVSETGSAKKTERVIPVFLAEPVS